MKYYILPTDNDIEHKAHKYVDKKMGHNGKWIYYYTTKPSLAARTGKYAGEKLTQQKMKSASTLYAMKNNSREDAERKRDQRNIELEKVAKAQADYDATIRGKLEKFATKGMAYLEKLGIVSTQTKNVVVETKKTKEAITVGRSSIPRATPTTTVSRANYSVKPTTVVKRKKTKLRDRR